jgi:ATP-dependent DNA helicase DinG
MKPLTFDEKNAIRAGMRALQDGIDGFTVRRPQLEMIATVAHTFAHEREDSTDAPLNLAVIEAGTGTGKSFGALVPALAMARSRGKRLIVSSSTVALQQQYANKDAPTLARLLPEPFTYAIAKGRSRYVCVLKLEAWAADARGDDETLAQAAPPSDDRGETRRRATLVRLARDFADGAWSGDRDDLHEPVAQATWNQIVMDARGCGANHCVHVNRCPLYAARKAVAEADLIIANHDLVLAAAGAEGGGTLPPPEESFVVFDEAHGLTLKAVEHGSGRQPLAGAQSWIRDLLDAFDTLAQHGHVGAGHHQDSARHGAAMVQALGHLHDRIEATAAFGAKRVRRWQGNVLPGWAMAQGLRLREAGASLRDTLTQVREGLLRSSLGAGLPALSALATIGHYLGRAERLVDAWELLLQQDEGQGAPVARWVEVVEADGSNIDYALCAAPVDPGPTLQRLLWRRVGAAVLMSATLTSSGRFDLFLGQAGIAAQGLRTLRVASPFDYRGKARLVIPAMRTSPTNPEAHTVEVIEMLPRLINTRGTLVLFASARQMHEVHAALPPALAAITLVQGAMPKPAMLARHRDIIDQGGRSVIFGLQSLAEGVDLPGDYCTHVISAKLPFSVPDSPIEEARREWIESQGRSAFLEVVVPEASIRLTQQAGRLLRTIHDSGRFTILDRRLITKRWGRLLLDSLPDFQLVVEREHGDTVGDEGPEPPAPADDDGASAITEADLTDMHGE